MEPEKPKNISTEATGVVLYDESIESFKAMFNFFKGKRDTDLKVFNANKIITKEDIYELNDLVQRKLYNHDIQGNLVNISLEFSDNDTKSFGNWAAFKSEDWNHSCFTNSIVIEWDFNVLFPNLEKKIPQPHSMRVRMGSGLRPNEFFQAVMTGAEDHEIKEAMSAVVFKIDFVNVTLSAELKTIVANWYNSLTDNDPEGLLIRLAKNHSGKIIIMLNFMFLVIPIFLINMLVITTSKLLLLNTPANVLRWEYFYLSMSFPVFYGFWKISNSLTRRTMESTVYSLKKPAMIRLTRGDKNRAKDVYSLNRALANDLAKKIGVTILAGVLLYVVRDFLPAFFKTIVGALTQ